MFLAAGAMLAAVLPPATASGQEVVCPAGQVLNRASQVCSISVSIAGTGGHSAQSGQADVVDQGGSVAACVNDVTQEDIPCESLDGYWVNDRQCYVKLMEPQPPHGHALWQGNTAGAIYQCSYLFAVMPLVFWSESMPAGPAAPVDPAAVAQTIVEQMELRAIAIGMVPEDSPGSMGIVGLPMWLWVADPSEQTFGPMTRSASLGGVTVTATAQVQKVLWEMGDGNTVTCWTDGTPFTDGHGGQQSPDCGYTYSQQGTYTIRATSYWSVDWTSTSGPSGSIPLQFTQSRIVQVGELQVVRSG